MCAKDLVISLNPDTREKLMEKVQNLQKLIMEKFPEKFSEKLKNFAELDVPQKLNILRQSSKNNY